MIYVTGDTHGIEELFENNNMNDATWTENDYLIICGDFGYVFFNDKNEEEFLDILAQKPYTICFCDGNHDNIVELSNEKKFEKVKWNGGYVHRIRKNIFHLMRGEIFEIEDKTILAFGGAFSTDRYRRRLNITYWEEELPSEEEYNNAIRNLEKYEFKVDYIITHTAPQLIVEKMIRSIPWNERPDFERYVEEEKLMDYLGSIEFKTNFTHWYFGHWHLDISINDKSTAVYRKIHKL